MQNFFRKLFIPLTIVMSFVMAQSVWADTYTVEGTIVEISEAPQGNIVTLDTGAGDLVDVNGVGYNRLEIHCNLTLALGDYVVFNVYKTECQCGRPLLVACGEITVIGTTTTTCEFKTACPAE